MRLKVVGDWRAHHPGGRRADRILAGSGNRGSDLVAEQPPCAGYLSRSLCRRVIGWRAGPISRSSRREARPSGWCGAIAALVASRGEWRPDPPRNQRSAAASWRRLVYRRVLLHPGQAGIAGCGAHRVAPRVDRSSVAAGMDGAAEAVAVDCGDIEPSTHTDTCRSVPVGPVDPTVGGQRKAGPNFFGLHAIFSLNFSDEQGINLW